MGKLEFVEFTRDQMTGGPLNYVNAIKTIAHWTKRQKEAKHTHTPTHVHICTQLSLPESVFFFSPSF